MLGALITDAVGPDTASEGQTDTSGGADSRKMARGSVLELGEGLIDGEGLRNVSCALCTDAVVEQTAIESQTQTSGGADGREMMRGGVPEQSEGRVCLQALRNVLGPLITDVVPIETANESRKDSSGGADVFMQKASTKRMVQGYASTVPYAVCAEEAWGIRTEGPRTRASANSAQDLMRASAQRPWRHWPSRISMTSAVP